MKTTIVLPDELYRKAKAVAALNGRKLKDVVAEGLRLLLEAPHQRRRHRSLAELMSEARGVIDSGISDLGSNPQHLKGLGRRAGHR